MCGIWAFSGSKAPGYVAKMAPWHMHRGQEGVSYACNVNGVLMKLGNTGNLASTLCLGHARYSTSGPYGVELQPIVLGDMAMVFNGTIANYKELVKIMRGWGLEVTNDHYDAWVLAMYLRHLLMRHDIDGAVRRLFTTVKGGYAIIAAWKEQLLLIRDPWGIRPLSIGFNDDGIAAASETSALEVLGMRWRELEPGRAVVINPRGDAEVYGDGTRGVKRAYCALEYIYFMRPDSYFNGISVYSVRQRLGLSLARKEPIKDIDTVTSIPESARVAAQSYARALGKPMEDLIVKNRFLGRNFIKPPMERNQELYGVIKEGIRGKSLVVVDDSIIRGDTLRLLIPKLRGYGARAIHVRISSPPIRYPCFMGMDFPTRRELIAHGKAIEDVRKALGSDSLIYLTVDELLWSIGVDEVCTACFTGNYPFNINIDEVEGDFTR
jgi:amidophosphoribosyltransferase